MRGYPRWFYLTLLLTMLGLVATGGLLMPTTLDVRLEWDVPWRLRDHAQIAMGAAHATLAFWMMSMMGALWNVHMRAGWRHRKHWRSGIVMVLLLLLLMATAIGIYYLSDDAIANKVAILHLLAGLLLAGLFAYHAVIGFRRAAHHGGHRHY